MTRRIIALTSFQTGAGKTTVSNMIRQQAPEFQKLSFAGVVRDMVRPLLLAKGVDAERADRYLNEQKEHHIDELTGICARDLLITFAEVAKAEYGADFWANHLAEQIQSQPETSFVIDDLRFSAELDALNRLGAEIWRVSRFDSAPEDNYLNAHPDVEINNTGTQADLQLLVERALAKEEGE